MRLRTGPILVLALTSLTLASLVSARQVVVTSSTPLRTRANKSSPSQLQLAVGLKGEVLSQSGGWLQLKFDDGRTGWVYETHLKDVPDASSTTSTTLATEAPTPGADASAPPAAGQGQGAEDLKAEIATLRAKIDSMNEALKAQRDAHPEDAGEHPGDLASRDGIVSWAVAALLVGLFVGWVASRLLQRRSDRRQWNKLRF